MPIKPWTPLESRPTPPPGAARVQRRLYVTDRNGVEVEITSNLQLQQIISQMTPEELAEWKQRYRFTPVNDDTQGGWTTGGLRDL